MCSTPRDDNPQPIEKLLEELRLKNEKLRLEDAAPGGELESFEKLQADLAAARAGYDALADATQTLLDDREKLRQRIAELEAVNARLVEMVWGRRSERRTESPDQQHLDFGDPEEPPPSPEEQEIISAQAKADQALDEKYLRDLEARRKAREKRRKAKRARQEFPPHMERRVRTIDLPEEEKAGLKLFRIDVTEKMCFEPPKGYVERIERYEYIVPGQPEEGVKSAPVPLSIVVGCKYDFSTIAAAIVMKYAFHQPMYRQQDWFAQCGWFPSRSTLNDLFNYGVDTCLPLYNQTWNLLLGQPILLGDDTRLRVLLRGALSEEELEQLRNRSAFAEALPGGQRGNGALGGAATSYAWLYTGLDGMAPYNVFHWSLTHQNSVIDEHLAAFRGIFVGDACGANARLEERSKGRIRHSSCNAHARREFIAAESSEPILASQALSFYRQLYEVEERGKPLDAAGRLALRQGESVPIWERFQRWLAGDALKRVLPKSPMGEALGYVRNQWPALQVYLSDGRLPIDNNQSEQTIRPLTVGRNNWLFLGHPHAAPGRLQLFSIVSSAQRHHLLIQDYLEDVLRKLADAAQNHPADLELGSAYLLDLLPDRWAALHPASVRQERIDERQAASDQKRERRTRARLKARAASLASR
jgi:transposase